MSRHLGWILIAAGACSVPDKKLAPDGGLGDAAPPDAPGDVPDTTITSAPPEFSKVPVAMFEFRSSLPGATFECHVDTEASMPCTSPFSRALGDGPHVFSVRASAPSGLTDATPAEHLWTIDTVPPDTALTETPPSADNSVMVRFSFESEEANTTFECALDTGSFVPCTTGHVFGPIGDGSHSFSVRARDRAGNVDPSPAMYTWTVDTSTPDTQIVTGPSGASSATTASFTFVSPDAGAGATFQCRLDSSTFEPCGSPKDLVGLTEGNHTFYVRVRDAVGNLDPTPATRSWLVDLSPPDTTILSGPTGLVAQASASFTFSSNETGVTFECSVDGTPFAACTSPDNLTGLAQGNHTFAVRATDAAGHTDASPATRAWSIDTIPPDVTITSGPAANSTTGPYVVIGFTVSEGTVACSLDSGAFAPCTSPFAANLPPGGHAVRIRATDAAGNVATAQRVFTVACGAPDPAGAAGLLHLDDGNQTQANAVTGGAAATLGDTVMVEPADPAPVPGRFSGALAFTASEGDHVSWPLGLTVMPDFTLELWARPDANAGPRDLAVSAGGGLALRATADSPSTVRLSIMVGAVVVTSAPVAAGAWHHVLVSRATGTLRLWVDGVRTEAAGANGAIDLSALKLGGAAAAAYGGALDEVWLAQTPITTDDAARGRYCPL